MHMSRCFPALIALIRRCSRKDEVVMHIRLGITRAPCYRFCLLANVVLCLEVEADVCG